LLDDPVVEEAMRLTGIRTKREVVNFALVELVETRHRKNLLDLFDSNLIDEGYDYKTARKNIA
jgi:Arc/MetJ family transcription regulator